MGLSVTALKSQLDASGLGDIALDAAAITVHDSTADPAGPFKALWVGATGDIKINTIAGNDVVFKSVPVGFFKVACLRIWSTGTTVTTPNTNIVGLK